MKMPSISIMTMVLGGKLADGSLTDVGMLQALERMGFDGIEVFSNHLLSKPGLLDAYAAYLAGSSLRVTCVDGGCNFIGADPASRAKGVDDLRAAIDVAARLNCPLVLAAGSRLSGDITPADGRRMIVEGLQACQPSARAAGVKLGIEDFGVAPTLQCAASHCLEILDAASGLVFVFDTGNFYFSGEDPVANFPLLGPRTCHVHLKDWVKSATPEIADVSGTFLGKGLIPNEQLVLKFLAAGGVDCFSLEVGAPGDKLDAAREDLQTVRNWLCVG